MRNCLILGLACIFFICFLTSCQAPALKSTDANTNFQSDVEYAIHSREQKTVFLTFDDGPSIRTTDRILDILKENNIKATFFVLGSYCEIYPILTKRIYDEGHTIGNHGYSHIYKKIYASPTSFLEDMDKSQTVLKNILGEDFKTRLIRFPSGSNGKKMEPFRKKVVEAGYAYVDWNAVNGDGMNENIQKYEIMQNVKKTSQGKDTIILLMHDNSTKKTTVDSLQDIIDYYRGLGYTFDKLPS